MSLKEKKEAKLLLSLVAKLHFRAKREEALAINFVLLLKSHDEARD